MTPAVRVDRVSKRYDLPDRLPGPAGDGEFWAVRDVSFDVTPGETLGLIGANGAGKSTLLKLLSRITAPTRGEIALRGRVAALIEVGSGFHPELTGRENIFLSGSILGMRRREIAAKLDRIVEFSGVGDFLDVPVKRYSSGMYVRLGFSVAAHLEADILLVDEVLGVGDAAFQLQCHERLNELRRQGTTMIFISHDLVSLTRLCDRVALMANGRLAASGAPDDIVRHYQTLSEATAVRDVADVVHGGSHGAARIADVRFVSGEGGGMPSVATAGPLRVCVELDVAAPVADAVIELFFYSRDGRVLHCQYTTALEGDPLLLEPGPCAVAFSSESCGLQPGLYAIGAAVRERSGAGVVDWWYGSRLLSVSPGRHVRGNFYAPHTWTRVAPAARGERRPADV